MNEWILSLWEKGMDGGKDLVHNLPHSSVELVVPYLVACLLEVAIPPS